VANEVATTFWLWQIAEMAESFRRNHETLMLKAGALKLALGFTAVEILALAAAFLFASFRGQGKAFGEVNFCVGWRIWEPPRSARIRIFWLGIFWHG
jgi:hypothetical protein